MADVPPLGYKTFTLVPTSRSASAATISTLVARPTKLEGPYYVVELDAKHGGVRRFFDKQFKREVLTAGDTPGTELWSPENPQESSTQSTAQFRVSEAGPLRATIQVRSTIGCLPLTSVRSASIATSNASLQT